jgi:serine/threonine protein kinase
MQYGKWEVIKTLGQGGQGVAYLVNDINQLQLSTLGTQLSSTISALTGSSLAQEKVGHALGVLKIIEEFIQRESDRFCYVLKLLHEPARQDTKALERLRREIDILTQLDHPSLIKVIDASVDEGWYVTPYYREGTLAQHLGRFHGRPVEALEALRSLVRGVELLHSKSAVHRDIKPENIFVSGSRLVLGDFGIVYFEDDAKTRVSDTYENVGSRDWMPGWAMGMRVDEVRPSFDVFSLGKVLWAMVSGRTKLRLWYWDRDEFNLTQLFPNDARMLWVNRLLQGSVREDEHTVYPSAAELLDQIDTVLPIVRRGGQVMHRDVVRWCRVCGLGHYRLALDEKSSSAALHDFGFSPVGQTWRIFKCDRCGHLDMFDMKHHPSAWGDVN